MNLDCVFPRIWVAPCIIGHRKGRQFRPWRDELKEKSEQVNRNSSRREVGMKRTQWKWNNWRKGFAGFEAEWVKQRKKCIVTKSCFPIFCFSSWGSHKDPASFKSGLEGCSGRPPWGDDCLPQEIATCARSCGRKWMNCLLCSETQTRFKGEFPTCEGQSSQRGSQALAVPPFLESVTSSPVESL